MSHLNDIKQLATAFTKISHLNTAFHKAMGVKGKGLKLSHGEALSIICNIYGYKTLNALNIAIDNNTFERNAPIVHVNNKYQSLSENIQNDLIDLFIPYVQDEHQAMMVSTLASTCNSFMIQEWMFQHEKGENGFYNSMLFNAFDQQGQWNKEFVDFFLFNEYSRLKTVRESEYSPYINGSTDLKQAYLNYAKKELSRLERFNFDQLFRCGVFHTCLAIYDNSPEKIVALGDQDQNDLDKIFKGLPIKKNPEKCCMAINGIVGDFLSATQDNCYVQYGELFKTALYKNTDLFNQILDKYPLPKRQVKPKNPLQTLFHAYLHSSGLNAKGCREFLISRNIDPKYQFVAQSHFSSCGYLLTKYISPILKSQQYWFVLDRVPTELNIDSYEWGMAAKVYSKLLKHYIFEYMNCVIPNPNDKFNLDKFIKSLYITQYGVICMNTPNFNYSAEVIHKGGDDHKKVRLEGEELFLYLTIRAMSHVILDMIGKRNLHAQIACTDFQFDLINTLNRYLKSKPLSSLDFIKDTIAQV